MRFKLDENLGRRGRDLLTAAGHNVATVFDQNLNQAPDSEIIEVCRQERRCLVTLDLDFGNPPCSIRNDDVRRTSGTSDQVPRSGSDLQPNVAARRLRWV